MKNNNNLRTIKNTKESTKIEQDNVIYKEQYTELLMRI